MLKSIFMSCCLMLLFNAAEAQSGMNVFPDVSERSDFVMANDHEMMKATTPLYASNFDPNMDDKCRKYKKMRNVGIGLLIGGAAFMAGGGALIAIGVSDEAEVDSDLLIAGGVVSFVFGLATTGAGIPLTIIGAKTSHKYCNPEAEGSTLYLKSGKNGLGLSMTF